MLSGGNQLIQKIDYAVFNQLRTQLVWIYEAEVLPLNLHLSSYVPEQTAVYVLSGKGNFNDANGEAEVHEGEWIFWLRDTVITIFLRAVAFFRCILRCAGREDSRFTTGMLRWC